MNAKIRRKLEHASAACSFGSTRPSSRISTNRSLRPPTSATRSAIVTAASPMAASAPCTSWPTHRPHRDIDDKLHLLKLHLPYHESDHVLNFAYNALCDGTCLQDLELRRKDEVYLDALGTERIPDPTTAGDFCRRFRADVHTLLDVFNDVRQSVWARQPAEFFE